MIYDIVYAVYWFFGSLVLLFLTLHLAAMSINWLNNKVNRKK